MDARAAPLAARRAVRAAGRLARIEADRLASRRGRADLAVFHELAASPGGGGHQFLRALAGELERRGLAVEWNRLSGGTPSCLFNSFNFDFARLRRFARDGVRMVHRVDGPIGAYRGFDDGTDLRILELNRELAEATVLQSRYSLEKHVELGFELREPVVITNAVDASIFHPPESRPPLAARRARIVASSWSENPRKGASTLEWLDRNLDPERYELTFVGQTARHFERVQVEGPFDSHGVARVLREHDLYLAASRDDPCSNALLEALACGLPVAYFESGGHPELVGAGGLPFRADEELPEVLGRLVAGYEAFRDAISVPALADVADRYLDVLGLGDRGLTPGGV